MIKIIDIGDLCTHCGRDTSFGNGLFVNRIPSGSDAKLMLPNLIDEATSTEEEIDGNLLVANMIDVTVNGYMCAECQAVECDQCGASTLDYAILRDAIYCSDCTESEVGNA